MLEGARDLTLAAAAAPESQLPGATRGRAVRWALLAAVAGYAIVLARTAWVSDDAFITLRVVDNLLHGFGARWNVAERVQTYTHPLWFLLLAAISPVVRDGYYAALALGAAASLATVALVALRLRADRRAILVAIVALALSKAFVDYSTSGLENPLTHLLLVAFVLQLPDGRPDGRTLVGLGLIAGLATLNRMDAALLVAPALALALVRHRRPRGLLLAGLGFLPFAAWEAFSLLYYGAPYPNTALAKLATGIPAGELAAQGLSYLQNSIRWDPITLAVIGAAVVAAAAARRAVAASLALGAVLYLAYVVRIGGDFMSGRFLSAPFLLAVLALLRAGVLERRVPRLVALAAVAVLGLAGPRATVRSGPRADLDAGELIDPHGVADERRYYFHVLGLWNGQPGWERPVLAGRIRGLELRRAGTPLAVEGGVGETGYLAGPAVHVLDPLALGDPLLARLPMSRPPPGGNGAPAGPGWRIGHFRRNVPAGYLATLLTGENRIQDPAIAGLYDRVALVTRGPIWSAARLREIARLALRPGLDVAPPPARGVDWDEYVAVRPDEPEGHWRRAHAAVEAGAHGAAVPDLAAAIRLDPAHVLAFLDAAEVSLQLGDREGALALALRAASLQPGLPAAHEMVGRCAWAVGRLGDAVAAFERGAALDRTAAPTAYARIGRLKLDAGAPGEAAAWLRRALDALPRFPEAETDLGVALLRSARPREAAEAFERALAIDPVAHDAAFGAADAWIAAGDPARAGAALDLLLRGRPDDADALNRRAELHDAAGEAAAAVRLWTAAARMGHGPSRRALEARGLSW
jgi:arabinofuranosyltransferase